jgi:hypothetical protein
MDADLQASAAHANRFLDLVAVDHEFLRLNQQQALVIGYVDGLGGFHHPCHVDRRDLLVAHDHHTGAVLSADMAAGNPGKNPGDLAIGHHFRFLERGLDRLHGGVDVDHHAAFQALGGRHAQTGQAQFPARHDLGHHRHDLGRANIQANDEVLVFLGHQGFLAFLSGLGWVVMPTRRNA